MNAPYTGPAPVGSIVSRLMTVTKKPCRGCGVAVAHLLCASSCPECGAGQGRQWHKEEIRKKCADLLDRGYVRKSTFASTFDRSIAALEDEKAYRIARDWRPHDRGGAAESIYIQGDIGCGKTYLARCIVNRCLTYKKVQASEISALEFTEIARQFDNKNYGVVGTKRPHSPTQWLESLKCLLIDDLDKAPWTERSISFLWQLLNRRRENRCVTIYTSNFPVRVREGSEAHSLEKLLNKNTKNASVVAAILDRMLPIQIIEMTGTSLRYRQRPKTVLDDDTRDKKAMAAVVDDGVPF